MKMLNVSYSRKYFHTYGEAECFAKDLEENCQASVKIVPTKVLFDWAVDWCEVMLEDEDES